MGSVGMLFSRVRAVEPRVIDALAAVLLTVGGLLEVATHGGAHPGPVELISSAAATGSVAWRRRNPVVTSLVAVAGMVVFQFAGGPDAHLAFQPVAALLSFYTLGRDADSRGALGVGIVTAACGLGGIALIADLERSFTVGALITKWSIVVLPFAAGRLLSRRQALARELQVATARLQQDQELTARRAAVEERNRIARELHDVIAHDVSVMVIQASAARRVASGDREAARAALGVVERCGREALAELRRVIGVVRRDEDGAISAMPGLAQLPALAARMRAAGLPVEVAVETGLPVLSPGLDLVAYRVVQESLTNALKHAGPASAAVWVGVTAGALVVEVTDTGQGRPAEAAETAWPGHGLAGMRERVALYGGELRAGPRRSRGFEVRARIPLERRPS